MIPRTSVFPFSFVMKRWPVNMLYWHSGNEEGLVCVLGILLVYRNPHGHVYEGITFRPHNFSGWKYLSGCICAMSKVWITCPCRGAINFVISRVNNAFKTFRLILGLLFKDETFAVPRSARHEDGNSRDN